MSAVPAIKHRPKLYWEMTPIGWRCYDENYDWAPDETRPSPVGYGKTKDEALQDYLEQTDEHV